MTAGRTASGKRIGRRPKPKDEVLGVSVAICMPRRLHQELLKAATAEGYTRPEFVRILLKDGLGLWRLKKALGHFENPVRPPCDVSSITEEHDATR